MAELGLLGSCEYKLKVLRLTHACVCVCVCVCVVSEGGREREKERKRERERETQNSCIYIAKVRKNSNGFDICYLCT